MIRIRKTSEVALEDILARTEPGTTNGAGLSCLLVEKGPKVKVRRLEHKLGITIRQ